MSIEFRSTLNPNAIYTRLGKKTSGSVFHKIETKEGTAYLGDALLRITKEIQDKNKKTIGSLNIVFSVNHLLNKYFQKNKVQITPIDNGRAKAGLFNFKVRGLPYLFIINQKPPSFWEFIVSSKFQLGSILLFGVLLLMMGFSFRISFSRRI